MFRHRADTFRSMPELDPEPSCEDQMITKRIRESGKLLGLPLVDHIIAGESGFYSFRKHGLIDFNDSNEVA